MSELLEIRNLSKTYYTKNNELKVLNNINMKVFKGEFLCILGPSGCGKTTLLKHMGGFILPDSGEIVHGNKRVVKPEIERIMVFQEFNQLLPWKTVLENVMFPLKRKKQDLSREERLNITKHFLSLVELGEFENYYPHQLSGGMKQRAAIARALALKPEILLMDEPFGSLDAQTRSQLQSLLIEIWEKTGVTIVFVTHDIQEAILLSNRIAVMDKLPGGIREIADNTIPRPRNPLGGEFIEMQKRVYALLEKKE